MFALTRVCSFPAAPCEYYDAPAASECHAVAAARECVARGFCSRKKN